MKQYYWLNLLSGLALILTLAAFANGKDHAIPDNWTEGNVANSPPTISVWYGTNQSFGHLGNPQPWVNILGNVSDPDGIMSLTYSLNGGALTPLNIGPDNFRLVDSGDFNIDIPVSTLNLGANQVVITAKDGLGSQTTKEVTVSFRDDTVWPLPFYINWSDVDSIQDAVQVVDGLWELNGSAIKPNQLGYDRLVTLGNISWTEYEITVPITVHNLNYNPSSTSGIGLVVRWQGHENDGSGVTQPFKGWYQHGAILWYHRYGDQTPSQAKLRVHSRNAKTIQNNAGNRKLQNDIPYYFKVRVENSGSKSLYKLRVWEVGTSEPLIWDLIAEGNEPESTDNGSILLINHKSQASYGNVSVVPLNLPPTIDLTINTTSGGSITINPDKPNYYQNDQVTLTAVPDSGWYFSNWSGNLSGVENPAVLLLDSDKVVTANFSIQPTPASENSVFLPVIIRTGGL